MSDTAWISLANIVVTICGLAGLWIKTSYAVALGESNNTKLSKVETQTNGLNAHLVKLTGESEFARGVLQERQNAAALADPQPPMRS